MNNKEKALETIYLLKKTSISANYKNLQEAFLEGYKFGVLERLIETEWVEASDAIPDPLSIFSGANQKGAELVSIPVSHWYYIDGALRQEATAQILSSKAQKFIEKHKSNVNIFLTITPKNTTKE